MLNKNTYYAIKHKPTERFVYKWVSPCQDVMYLVCQVWEEHHYAPYLFMTPKQALECLQHINLDTEMADKIPSRYLPPEEFEIIPVNLAAAK